MKMFNFAFDLMSVTLLDNYAQYCFERQEKLKEEKIYFLKPKELENIKGE